MNLSDSTAFYKVCFDSMLVGILVFNEEMEVVLANNPLTNLFGYKKNKLVGIKVDSLFENELIIKNFVKNPESAGYTSALEAVGIKHNGKELFLELSFGSMEYESERYFKILINDISERKKEETRINNLNVLLEEEVKLSNKELQKVIAQLKNSLNKEKELNNLKTQFIALASHEFKTPLSAILSSTELMVKYAGLKDVEKINEHLYKVKIMIARLNGMLDDLLTLENIEAGEIKKHYIMFDFQELTQNFYLNKTPLLKESQLLKIENNIKNNVCQDPNIIKIILNNLLSNAIKFSGENSHITIVLKENKSNIYITVKDNGIGIPKNEQNLIFNRFFRAKNAIYYPGTGIGLNIVKGYVIGLNGAISFKSLENSGTIFYVQLPKIMNYEKENFIN